MASSDLLTRSSSPSDGITGAYTGDSFAIRSVIITLTTLACYNALELNVLIFATFKRYHGLYFWSLLIASWGVVLYGLGFLFKFFHIVHNDYGNVVLITIGWWSMITGQSMVLYSRLHLLSQNQRLLRAVLWMILLDVLFLHFPTTVLTFGSNSPTNTNGFVRGYNVMEKIQMTGFCIQEFIISGIYLWECARFLKIYEQQKSRRTLYELFCINLVIIIMDLSLLSLEYANLYILEIIIKGVVYSIKLKLEFALLGKLVQYVKPPAGMSQSPDPVEVPTFIDVSRVDTVESHPMSGGGHHALKPSWTRDTEAKGLIKYEHLETRKSQSSQLHPSTTLNPEQTRTARSDVEEDDLEMMMRRYSVPREKD